jgi:serine/threonine protein kinase
MPIAPGTRLGSYEIVSLLGVGGMGEVYRARDVRLRRDVAIKTLPAALIADRDRLARFEREARVLASLNHPNIATLFAVEEGGEGYALVMELVDGETLAELIRRKPLPLGEALWLARQIVDALDVAHEKGIIHRDLKPANIKVTADRVVKVLDFGLAKAVGRNDVLDIDHTQSPTRAGAPTLVGVIMGTAEYMSPEQARGKTVDKRTDIWAFGCVLYEMLVGRAPFARDTLTDTFAAIVEREPDWQALPAGTPLPSPPTRTSQTCRSRPATAAWPGLPMDDGSPSWGCRGLAPATFGSSSRGAARQPGSWSSCRPAPPCGA